MFYRLVQCVAVYCNVLQCIAVYCSVLQCIAMCCSAYFSETPTCCSVVQCAAVYDSVLHCGSVYCSASFSFYVVKPVVNTFFIGPSGFRCAPLVVQVIILKRQLVTKMLVISYMRNDDGTDFSKQLSVRVRNVL